MTEQAEYKIVTIEHEPSLPGDGMAIMGLVFLAIGVMVFLGSLFVQTNFETPPIEGISTGRMVGNLPAQHSQLMIALGGSVLAVIGTLLYGFGATIKTLSGRAAA